MDRVRVFRGDRLRLVYAASAAPTSLRATVYYQDDQGVDRLLSIPDTTSFTTDRTQVTIFGDRASKDGWITGGGFGGVAGGRKRGEFFASLILTRGEVDQIVASGYYYALHNVTVGELEESTSGKGFLDWIQIANDVAGNVVTTTSLAASNARRIIRAIIVKYHASADVASRVINIDLRDVGDTSGPTGFSIDNEVWVSAGITLTASEEGVLYVGDHGFVSFNDNDTVTYADNTTAPNPFPLPVEEGDTADLRIAITSGNANDDYDAFLQIEEWIEI